MAIQNQSKDQVSKGKGSVTWYVRPIGDESYHNIREYLENAEHVTMKCNRAGRMVPLQLFKVTAEQRDYILKSDNRFSREIYKRYGEDSPFLWSSVSKLQRQVKAVVGSLVKRRGNPFIFPRIH